MVRNKQHKALPSCWLIGVIIACCFTLYAYCFYKNIIERPDSDCAALCDDDDEGD